MLFVRLFDLCLFGFVGFLFLLCLFGFVGFLFLLDLGRAAVCDCGTPWTFLLPFLTHYYLYISIASVPAECYSVELAPVILN